MMSGVTEGILQELLALVTEDGAHSRTFVPSLPS
jgi:hypothetical protein